MSLTVWPPPGGLDASLMLRWDSILARSDYVSRSLIP